MHRIPLRYGASSGAVGDGKMIFLGEDHPNGGRVASMQTSPQPYDVTPEWELMTRGQVSAKRIRRALDEAATVAMR